MKKVYLLFLALGVAVSVNAQKRASIKPEQKMVRPSQKAVNETITTNTNATTKVVKKSQPNKFSKDIALVDLGHDPNGYGFFAGSTSSNSSRAYVDVHQSLGLITFIHRGATGHGGATNSGWLMLDWSTDAANGWQTWNVDDSIWAPTGAVTGFLARYPQVLIYNPSGNTNPNDAYAVSIFPIVKAGAGLADTLGLVSKTLGNTNISKSLFNRYEPAPTGWGGADNMFMLPSGVFKIFDGYAQDLASGDVTDTLVVTTGTFNTVNNNFDVAQTAVPIRLTYESEVPPGQTAGFDHWPAAIKQAYSLDGNIGYVSFISHNDYNFQVFEEGDLNPVFIKSTDGGNTWSQTMNIGKKYRQMNAIKYMLTDQVIVDSLELVSTLDSVEYARTNIIQFTALQMENNMTIDANNNPHIFVKLNYSEGSSYYQTSYLSGIFDIYSVDGGTTWDARLITQVNQYFGEFGALHERNRMYVNRSQDGTKIFFSWLDSPKNSTNGNASPNIYVRAFDVNTGEMTDTINITAGTDAEEAAIMATPPYDKVYEPAAGEYEIPYVYISDLTLPTPYTYSAVTGFKLTNADFVAPINTTINNSVANQLTFGTITQTFGGNKVWANIVGMGIDTTLLVASGNILTNLDAGTYNIKLSNEKGYFTKFDNVTVISVNEINNNSVANFTAYPNPAKDQLNVNFNIEGSQNVTVKLVSVNGQVALAETFNANGNVNRTIDVSNYAQGIYFVQVVTANGVATQKVAIR